MPKMSAARWMFILIAGAVLLTPPFLLKYFSGGPRMNRAVMAGDVQQVEKLLAGKPKLLESQDNRRRATPLQWAVIIDQPKVFELLLARGANVDAGDKYGMTPLHSAAIFNHAEMAQRLVEHGADMYAMGLGYGAVRMTPLHKAAEGGAVEMAEVLLDAGMDVDTLTEGANEVSALHIAAARGHQRMIRLLVERGASVNKRDIVGTTPLRWAIRMDQDDAADLLRLFGGRE